MKTETWLRITLLIVLIFLCVFFGNKTIFEGALTASSTDTSTKYPSELNDLNEVGEILNEKVDQSNELQTDLTSKKDSTKTNLEIAAKLAKNIQSKQQDTQQLVQKKLDNSVVPSVVNLPLYENAINASYNKLVSKDKSNMTEDAAMNVTGNKTNMSYPGLNGQKCIKFQHDVSNYISFPFINPDKFSFSFWIYVDITDSNTYVVASITNYRNITTSNFNCSLEVDIAGSALAVYCALPSNNPWSIIHSYNGLTTGWTFIAFTYDTDFTTKLYINNNQNPVSVLKGTGKFMGNDIRSTPNVFILGRSGCSWGGGYEYKGYMRDFYFYALTLSPTEVLEMYCRNNNINDPKCNV